MRQNAKAWTAQLKLRHARSPGRIRIGGGSFLLGSPFKTSGNRGPLEVRSVDLPISVLADPAFTIESADSAPRPAETANPRGAAPDGDAIAEARQGPGAPTARITVRGLGPGLGELSRRCGNAAPVRPEPATERI